MPGGRRRLCLQMKCSTSIKGNEAMFNKTERLGGGGGGGGGVGGRKLRECC